MFEEMLNQDVILRELQDILPIVQKAIEIFKKSQVRNRPLFEHNIAHT